MDDKELLLTQLEENPGDWSIRIALIELAIREGDLPGAKRLVRASPDDVITPPHIQVKLHGLLTRGIASLGPVPVIPLPDEPSSEEAIPVLTILDESASGEARPVILITDEDSADEPISPSSPSQESTGDEPKSARPEADSSAHQRSSSDTPAPEKSSPTDPAPVEPTPHEPKTSKLGPETPPASSEKTRETHDTSDPAKPSTTADPEPPIILDPAPQYGGGLAALIEDDPLPSSGRSSSPRQSSRRADDSSDHLPKVDRVAAHEKWRNYDGALELVDLNLDLPESTRRPSSAQERISSVSLALIVHVVALVVLSLVAVQVHRPAPPQLIVSASHDQEADLVTTNLTLPSTEIKPAAAAAAQSVDVISSLATSSTFNVPEVENSSDQFIASTMPGLAAIGSGMSFSSDAAKSSDVSFFGLSGRGHKIVFIIDASPKMLVDEKGGMSAYDKVKDEIGIMLANLNRGTHFNILLYQGKQLVAFREELVPGLPSNLRQAIEWLDPLNRNYDALGLRNQFGPTLTVSGSDSYPIAAGDVAFYTKAIEKALEWQVSTIFCISSGYETMPRTLSEEMRKKLAQASSSTPTNPAEQRAWQAAVQKTREWLEKENAARQSKGLDPKVVTNFNQLVREITGASPPQVRSNVSITRPPAVTPEDIERQIDLLVKEHFQVKSLEKPSIHMVLFLGKDEIVSEASEFHFRNLTRKNRGKLKTLRGLAALKNVTKGS